MKSVLAAILTSMLASGAYAACAKTVSEAQRNGVYKHFQQMTGNYTWLTLKHKTKGNQVGVGVDGDSFKLEFGGNKIAASQVCTKGNGIEATVAGIKGEVTKVSAKEYDVKISALPEYSGRYVLVK